MFIVNSPFWFKAIWFVVKAFLDPKTVNKISILGSDYIKELSQYVALENLPDFLGGTCKCGSKGCLLSDEGPWKEYLKSMPSETDPIDAKIPDFIMQVKSG